MLRGVDSSLLDEWERMRRLVDAQGLNDWVLELEVDLAASRERGAPFLKLVRLASLV